MADSTWNRWKVPAFLSMLLVATALVTRFVVANWVPSDTGGGGHSAAPAAKASRAAANRPAVPTQADIQACNRYASAHVGERDKNWEVAKDALIGGAATAGLGAAAGAIADGGKGAGKGAAIGGIVGVAGGALYGINENQKHDEAYRAAYAGCLRARGYAG